MKNIFLLYCFLQAALFASAQDLLIEAESFSHKGGWVVDQQFMDLMGSSYLMAHGMGERVADATTEVEFPEKGTYYVYVRTFNWTSPWYDGKGPGQFKLSVGGRRLSTTLGCEGKEWMWQSAGKVSVRNLKSQLKLHDLTGFNGRCDAIYFTKTAGAVPPSDLAALEKFRRSKLNIPADGATAGMFSLLLRNFSKAAKSDGGTAPAVLVK